MLRILKPILIYWYPDLENIEEINKLRNQVAHRGNIEDVFYKKRNPFKDADSFAQVFFDAWAIRQCLHKFSIRLLKILEIDVGNTIRRMRNLF